MRALASSGSGMDFAAQWQGQVVDGRFSLEQYLGGSERHAIFLTHTEAGANASIKLVRAVVCDPPAQLAAWNAAAKLSHPHLIRVYTCGRAWLEGNDLLFVVTEFAEEDLSQVLPYRALTPAEAETMLRSVVSALEYLHGQGLVHGHICPASVMAIKEQVKLSSDSIQPPGTPVQTFEASPYDAPELASRRLSAVADMWSLGATVAQTVTQRVPTRAEGLSLPQPFADIARHTLSRDPASRWNIADVRAKLESSGQRSAGSARASVPASARTTSTKALWIAGVLVLVAVIAIALLAHREPQVAPKTATPVVTTTTAPTQSRSVAQDSPGSVLSRVLPTPSRGALDTITGHVKVRLRVEVDAAGNVVNAAFTDHGPSQYFARLAMEAAQRWKFAPTIRNGHAVSSEWSVQFSYSRGGVQASEQAVRGR